MKSIEKNDVWNDLTRVRQAAISDQTVLAHGDEFIRRCFDAPATGAADVIWYQEKTGAAGQTGAACC